MLRNLIHSGLAISLAVATVAAAASPSANKKDEGKLAITDKPLTVRIEPSNELRASLDAATKRKPMLSIRLTLEGVVPPVQRKLIEGIRVYINKPDATRDTSTDDSHFVAAFAFTPDDGRDPENLNFDLTRSLAELSRERKLDLTKPLWITLVAVPTEGNKKLPKDFSVSVGKVSVTAVDLSK